MISFPIAILFSSQQKHCSLYVTLSISLSNMIVQIKIELQLTSMGVKYRYLHICPQTIFSLRQLVTTLVKDLYGLNLQLYKMLTKKKQGNVLYFLNFTKIKD